MGGGHQSTAGSIPACAGEPQRRTLWRWPRTVYPRVCGGARISEGSIPRGTGLSPRVRGSPVTDGGSTVGNGSIPACAGEPTEQPGVRLGARVYPRVCGGAKPVASVSAHALGLSPRVRGSLTANLYADYDVGSIPACAGEPLLGALGGLGLRVYPRVCGGARQRG